MCWYVFVYLGAGTSSNAYNKRFDGETGASGTNWSITGNTLTTTGPATIQAFSVIETGLLNGEFID